MTVLLSLTFTGRSAMHHSSTLFVGLDVHKDSIAVAYASEAKDKRSSSWGGLGRASVTLTCFSANSSRKPNSLSLSTKQVPVGTGSTAISPRRSFSLTRLWPITLRVKGHGSRDREPLEEMG